MSLTLDQKTIPKGLYLKTYNAERIILGEYDLSIEDFACMVHYVMTNTDLIKNDVRLSLLKDLKKLRRVDGYGLDNKRLGIKD